MLPLSLAEAPKIAGADYFVVVVIAAIALGALVFAYYLAMQVMRADTGTPRMQEIARAVQEGASAYLNRQFKTLGAFVLIVFVLLLLLPVNEGGTGVRIGRSIFFVIGASFSALVGYFGMTLATRGNVRVAAAARDLRRAGHADRVPHRWLLRDAHRRSRPVRRVRRAAGVQRQRADGAGGLRVRRRAAGDVHAGRRRHLHQGRRRRRRPGRQGRGGDPGGRRRATPPPSRTTSATTSATAPAWPPTSSSRTR